MQPYRYRGFIRGLIAVGLLASLVSLTDKAQAASGNGPYYATPSWDQKLPAATRFVVLTDWNSEAVLDRNTGLVWEKSPDTATATWFSARFVCLNKNVGGQKGWRLPAIAELASLIDPSVASPGPTLPPGHPFVNIQSANYWSATTEARSPSTAFYVIFRNGNVSNDLKDFELDVAFVSYHAWCVRGGMNADAY